MTKSPETIRVVLNDLFRKEAGQVVATITRFLGAHHLDLAESMVQEALVKAMQSWPIKGIPDKPGAWLVTAAKNAAIDHIRRDGNFEEKRDALTHSLSLNESDVHDTSFATELADDQLRMLFTCCHPCLPPSSQIALTLKVLCGFGVAEIARAFLVDEKAIEQRIVRAKKRIREEKIKYEIPVGHEIATRMESVLNVIYAMFNEGYSAVEGDRLIKRELCLESIRLGEVLAQNSVGSQCPKLFALLALMSFQASRLNARIDSNGEIVLLEDQDRDRWDKGLIRRGLGFLERSAAGNELSRLHLEAGIAACHTTSKSYEETNWHQIYKYYGDLMALCPSPVIALNKAIALAMGQGVKKGLVELLRLEITPQLKDYHLYHAALADLYRRNGQMKKALQSYRNALAKTTNPTERRFIEKRILEVSKDEGVCR